VLLTFALSLPFWACAADTGPGDEADYREPSPLLRGAAQREQLCARGNQDPIADLLCGGDPLAFLKNTPLSVILDPTGRRLPWR
jgi:hypothetical protein